MNITKIERTEDKFIYTLDNGDVSEFNLVDEYNDYRNLTDEEVLLSRSNNDVEIIINGVKVERKEVDSKITPTEDIEESLDEVIETLA